MDGMQNDLKLRCALKLLKSEPFQLKSSQTNIGQFTESHSILLLVLSKCVLGVAGEGRGKRFLGISFCILFCVDLRVHFCAFFFMGAILFID